MKKQRAHVFRSTKSGIIEKTGSLFAPEITHLKIGRRGADGKALFFISVFR